MLKAGVSILFWLLILSCNRDEKNTGLVNLHTTFNSLANEKKYALALQEADRILILLDKNKDSLPAYIKLNAVLYDSAINWNMDKLAAEKYYYNIVSKKNQLINDTALIKYLATAWYRIGINHFSFTAYSDTSISVLEDFLLLNERLSVRQLKRELYVKARLGILYNIAGDIAKSLQYYTMAANGYKLQSDADNYLANINNKVIAFNELRLYDSSIKVIVECSNIPGIDYGIKALQLAMLADAELQIGMTELSEQHILESLVLIKKIKDPKRLSELADRVSQIFFIKHKIEKKQNDLTAATASLLESEKMEASNDKGAKQRQLAKRMIAMGALLEQRGRYDSAAIYYQKALAKVIHIDLGNILAIPEAVNLYPENTIIESLDAKAGVFQLLYQQKPDTKNLTTAVQCYTLSFEVEKKLMQYFSYDESKLLMLSESRQRSQKAINLCYQLYQLTKDDQWAEKAFEFAEKNKAFVLLESVKRNLASNDALQKDTLYKNAQKLQLQLAYTERNLAEATSDSLKQTLQQQKIKLDNDLLLANTALGRQSIAYKAVMEKEDSISASKVSAELLNEHTGLIEFFNADTVTYAFVLNKNKPLQFIRYNATMSAEIDSLLYFFKTASAIGNHPLQYQKMALQLYQTLQFDELDKGWQNLIIIPDGKLSLLPFDALITNSSFTVNLQQANYFVNRCNTLYGYSAAILLKQLHSNQSPGKNTTIFAPVFSNNENHQQPLLYSLEEAEAIATNKNTTSFIKEKATLNNFRQQFANSGILHIATHAYADTGTINNPKIEFIDSSLLLNELYAMHTNASLVVLSACETGLGKLNSSEGPMSLARGFYYAGARNVITSYWNVDDKSTAALFSSVYKNMESSSSSDAIYQAKKELIKNENGKFASPYYWAGFVHIGMPEKNKNRNYWWWALLLPAAGFIIYYLKRRHT